MKITKKILLAVILPFIISMTAGLLVIGIVFSLNVKEQKEKSNTDSIHKVTDHKENIENSFKETALSLSLFDGAYDVIAKKETKDTVLKHICDNFRIELMCFFNADGKYNAGKKYNLETDEYEEVENEFIPLLANYILSNNDAGYISVGYDIYIIVKAPFISSDASDYIVIGRRINSDFITELESVSRGNVSIIAKREIPVNVNQEDHSKNAYIPLNNEILSEDSLMLKINFHNQTVDRVVKRMYVLAIVFLVLMILVIFVILWFVGKYINKPILSLTDKIKGMTQEGIDINRINAEEDNEFTELAQTIDTLLDTIESGRQEIVRINDELKKDVEKRILAEETVRRKEAELSLILNSAAEGILCFDLQSNCTFSNRSGIKILGYDHDSTLIGKNIVEILKEEAQVREGLDSKTGYFIKKDRSLILTEYYSYPQVVDGKTVGTVITFFDITEKKRMEDMLRESERSKDMLLSNLIGMAYRCKKDENWTMLFVSDGCYDLTGYRPEELLYNSKITFNDLITPEYREYLWRKWEKLLPIKGVLKEEYKITTASGEEKWVLEQGRGVYDDNGEVIALEGLIVDITTLKNREREIQYLSYHDNLTDVYNRIYLEKEKERFNKEELHPISVIVGDIDGLKFINDAFGHALGDELIAKTAAILKECCGPNGIIARVGGDEFNIFLPNTDEEEAYSTLKRMQKEINDFSEKNGNIYRFTVSLGYSTKKTVYDDINDVIKLADDYMYKRKMLKNQSSHSEIVASIRETMNARSIETDKHCERLAEMSKLIADPLGLSEKDVDELELLSSLHDIGKIGIDDSILKKTASLTKEEWEAMQKHPLIGYRIAMATSDLKSIAPYILTHHERWDGQGYPQGLKGDQIPLLSRILAVIDSYDSMVYNRPYRKVVSKEEALKELEKNAGTQFDPAIVKVFVEWMRKSKID